MFDNERISAEDVRELQRDVFEHGLTSWGDVHALAALDRASPTADPLWPEFFITSLVEFVVWTSRPTGYVDKEAAGCVVAALRPMGQATANAQRAALEIVREAQQVDEALLPLLLMPREIAPTVPIHMAVLPPKRRARLVRTTRIGARFERGTPPPRFTNELAASAILSELRRTLTLTLCREGAATGWPPPASTSVQRILSP
ncbi:MAG: hypothetical protein K0R61_4521 [Microvirga sp.]|nr:hypothetical protein [Microvirga sp.]